MLNDFAIIYNEKFTRQLWKFGKIVELYKSADSKVRSAKIKSWFDWNTD